MKSTITLVVGLSLAALIAVAGAAAQDACLGRVGVLLCVGPHALTGDPGKDKCVIAQLEMQQAQVEVTQEHSPAWMTQPPQETHQLIMARLKTAQTDLDRDCPRDAALVP